MDNYVDDRFDNHLPNCEILKSETRAIVIDLWSGLEWVVL
jgi:hypothetical protein